MRSTFISTVAEVTVQAGVASSESQASRAVASQEFSPPISLLRVSSQIFGVSKALSTPCSTRRTNRRFLLFHSHGYDLPLWGDVAEAPYGNVHAGENEADQTVLLAFEPGASRATVRDTLGRGALHDYRVQASAGQTLTATLRSEGPPTILVMDDAGHSPTAVRPLDWAVNEAATDPAGWRWQGMLPHDGVYWVRVVHSGPAVDWWARGARTPSRSRPSKRAGTSTVCRRRTPARSSRPFHAHPPSPCPSALFARLPPRASTPRRSEPRPPSASSV